MSKKSSENFQHKSNANPCEAQSEQKRIKLKKKKNKQVKQLVTGESSKLTHTM